MKQLLVFLLTVGLMVHALNEIREVEPLQQPQIEVLEYEAQQPKYLWPMHAEDYIALSSPFGMRDKTETGGYGDDFHDGLDMFGYYRARILAVADGVVVEHWPPPNGYWRGHPVFGGLLRIQHRTASSLYAHLSSTYVHEGDMVSAGQIIGRQGATGRTASPHLHFELEIDGRLINPLRFLGEIE